jgi:hypothetical protein
LNGSVRGAGNAHPLGSNHDIGIPLFVHDSDALSITIQTIDEDIMITNLTSEEESYLQELLNSRGRGIPPLSITANLLLLFGGLLIVGTAVYIARHLTDEVVYSVGLPNLIGGLLLIAGYIVLSKRAAHLKRLTSLLSKLASMRVAA